MVRYYSIAASTSTLHGSGSLRQEREKTREKGAVASLLSSRHVASTRRSEFILFLFTFGKRGERAPEPMTFDKNPVTVRLQGSELHEQCACCPCLAVSADFCATRALPYDGVRGGSMSAVHHPGVPKAIATACSAGRCPTESRRLIIQCHEEKPGDGKHKVARPIEWEGRARKSNQIFFF